MRSPAILSALTVLATIASVRADLNKLNIYSGSVGLSVDALGSAESPIAGQIQATVPDGATVLAAYLYSAGTPSPLFLDSPTTLDDYNKGGITFNGTEIKNFDALVGAT